MVASLRCYSPHLCQPVTKSLVGPCSCHVAMPFKVQYLLRKRDIKAMNLVIHLHLHLRIASETATSTGSYLREINESARQVFKARSKNMESKPMQVFQLLEPLFRLENICFIIFLYFATSFAYQIIYHHFFNPLAKFPGPFWAGVTRFWLAYYDLRGQEQKKCEELCKKYGA